LNGLASAVANEGGVGVISCAGLGLIYRNTAKDYMEACICGLREEIKKAKEKTSGIIGVNVMMALTNFSDMVKTAIAEKADVIFAGADAKPFNEIPTPIPPCIIGSLAVRSPIFKLFILHILMFYVQNYSLLLQIQNGCSG
jgi:hypothetical protein